MPILPVIIILIAIMCQAHVRDVKYVPEIAWMVQQKKMRFMLAHMITDFGMIEQTV
jgi:hypothetical protein